MSRSSLVLSVAVAALVAAPTGGGARAEEAYLCEGNRVVYVKIEDLERLKREDKCIAAYYGLEVETNAPPRTAPAAAAGETKGGQTQPDLKPLAEPEVEVKARVKRGTRKAASGAGPATALAQPPVVTPQPTGHPATDYRNVRVLNAAPGETGIYRHRP